MGTTAPKKHRNVDDPEIEPQTSRTDSVRLELNMHEWLKPYCDRESTQNWTLECPLVQFYVGQKLTDFWHHNYIFNDVIQKSTRARQRCFGIISLTSRTQKVRSSFRGLTLISQTPLWICIGYPKRNLTFVVRNMPRCPYSQIAHVAKVQQRCFIEKIQL